MGIQGTAISSLSADPQRQGMRAAASNVSSKHKAELGRNEVLKGGATSV